MTATKTSFAGKCQGITITPYSAGHTLGGTIWKIRSPSSGTIVYAVDMNHTKERHLDGTVILRATGGGVFEGLARPDLLITDADRALTITPRRKDRDTAFLGKLRSPKLPQKLKLTFTTRYDFNYTTDLSFRSHSLRRLDSDPGTPRPPRSILDLPEIDHSHLPGQQDRPGDAHLCAKYGGMDGRDRLQERR